MQKGTYLMISIESTEIYTLATPELLEQKTHEKIVITKTNTGKPISYFEDNTWNFCYELSLSDHVKELKFQVACFAKTNFLNEVKRIILLHLCRPMKTQRNRSISSTNQILSAFKQIGIFIQNQSLNINDLSAFFDNESLLNEYIIQLSNKSQIKHFKRLIYFLNTLNSLKRGFGFISSNVVNCATNKEQEFAKTEQHLFIPNRIYESLIFQVIEDVDYVHSNINKIEALLLKTFTTPGFFMTKKRQKELFKIESNFLLEPYQAIQTFGLTELADKYQITMFENLNTFTGSLQGLCKILVIALTGMRTDDFNSITYGTSGNCIDSQTYDGETIPILWGYSKKLFGESIKVPWVIGKDAIKAIEVLQMIARVVFEASRNKKHLISESYSALGDMPLAINSLTLKGYVTGAMKNNRHAVYYCEKPFENKIIKRYELSIHASDIKELEQYHFELNDNKTKINTPWELKYHQLRRTLAVLAIESGIVRKTSLMRQLKHFTLVMTGYYSKNAQSNPFFFEEDDTSINGVKTEFQTHGVISLFQNNEVIGGTGMNMLHEIWTSFSSDPKKLRKQIEVKVRNGEIAFSESPCGGCLSKKHCNHKIQGQFIPCLTCTDALLTTNKLENLLATLKTEFDSIPQDDISKKFIQEEMNSVLRALNKLNQQKFKELNNDV